MKFGVVGTSGYCQAKGCQRNAAKAGHCRSCYERLIRPKGDGHTLTVDDLATANRMKAALKTKREIAKALGTTVTTLDAALKKAKATA